MCPSIAHQKPPPPIFVGRLDRFETLATGAESCPSGLSGMVLGALPHRQWGLERLQLPQKTGACSPEEWCLPKKVN